MVAILLAVTPPSGASEVEESAAFQFALARSLAFEGAVDEALTAWEEVLLLAADDAYVRVEYARFLVGIGRFAEASMQVEEARRLAPQNTDVLRAAADVHLAARRSEPGSVDKAVESLEELLRLQPANVQALIDLGRLLLIDLDQPERAATVLTEAVNYRPGSRTIQSFLVEAWMRASKRPEAEGVLSRFLDTDPEFLRGRLMLARQQSQRGDHRAARETLLGAPQSQLQNSELRWQLAGQLYRTGELERGLGILDGLLEESPDSFRDRLLKAMTLEAMGHNQRAIALYEGLLEDRPQSPEVVRALVKAFEREDLQQRAEELLRRWQESSQNEMEAAGRRGELWGHLMRSESWQTLAAESRAAAEDPESPLHLQAFMMYVEALRRTGQAEEALALLAGYSGTSVPAHRLASKEAELLAELDRVEEAQALLEQLADSTEVSSLLAAAQVYQRQERYAEAVPVLSKALENDQDSIYVRYWLGAAYERSGDPVRAVEIFRGLLRLDPGYAPALNYLGYMSAERGENLEEAIDMVDRALAQEPDNGAYVDSVGWAHFQLGHYDRARGLLERAARLLRDNPIISEHLGDLYAITGESKLARQAYARAIELDGENRLQVEAKLRRLPEER